MENLDVHMITDADNEAIWMEAYSLYEKVTNRYLERRNDLMAQ